MLKSLLAKGYLPQELPSVFTSKDFGEHSIDIIDAWRVKGLFRVKNVEFRKNGKRLAKAGCYQIHLDDAEMEVISTPKRGYERRGVHVTHPIAQALLSREICYNWRQVSKWLLKQYFSIDKIAISNRFDRSIQGINFAVHQAKKDLIEATSDWLVRTDITRFYPSIYTHSIPWAAYGKKRVKDNLHLYAGSVADRLDTLVRKCNRNQTIGIPIGPETSRIISEVISARIDDNIKLSDGAPDFKEADRLQDDWYIGARSFEKAEDILSTITRIYRDFGLEINGSKTEIQHIIGRTSLVWRSELSAFLSHRSGQLEGARLQEFLQMSLRLQSTHSREPVLNYALSVVEGSRFRDVDIGMLESFVLKAAVVSPISLNKICRIIVNVDRSTKRLSRSRVARRFEEMALNMLEKGHDYEALWLIYTIRGIKQQLKKPRIAEILAGYVGSCIPLVALDMNSNGLVCFRLPKSVWEDSLDADRVRTDWSWLLGYEGIRKGWLADKRGLMRKPFFAEMDSRDIVFYDPSKNVASSLAIKRRNSARRAQERRSVSKFTLRMRDFMTDEEEYW